MRNIAVIYKGVCMIDLATDRHTLICCLFVVIFTDKIIAKDEAWIVGDTFMATTVRENVEKVADESWFLHKNFEVRYFYNSRCNSTNTNLISRLQGTLTAAINKRVNLPKLIIIVLNRDVIEAVDAGSATYAATVMGVWLEWLAKQFVEVVETRRSQLLHKAQRMDEPIFYWSAIPSHKGYSYEVRAIIAKFNNTLESVLKVHPSMCLIKIKKGWQIEDVNLINPRNDKLSNEGVAQYWLSLDASVKFNLQKRLEFQARALLAKVQDDTSVKRTPAKNEDKMYLFFNKRRTSNEDKYDRFHWTKSVHRREDRREVVPTSQRTGKFLLPRPR